MADPPIPPTADTTQAVAGQDALTDAKNRTVSASDKATDAELKEARANRDLSLQLANTTNSFLNEALAKEKSLAVSEQSKVVIDLLAQSVMGAGTAYNTFSESMKNTQSFEAQATSMMNAAEKTGDLTNKLFSLTKAMNIKGGDSWITAIKAGVGGAKEALQALITETAKGADQALKLQMGFVSMMGATGGLPLLFDKAGGSLENLNAMMATQQEGVVQLARATGTTTDQIAPFYKMMGENIPGALGQSASLTEKSARRFDDLKGAMQLASGTGRDTTAIITDMKTSWDHYGLSGEKALQFTSSMSELSGKFGINLNILQDLLKTMPLPLKEFLLKQMMAQSLLIGGMMPLELLALAPK